MSRIGRLPISLNEISKFDIFHDHITLCNKNDKIKIILPENITASIDSNNKLLNLGIKNNSKSVAKGLKSVYGTERSILNSAVDGLKRGHKKILELSGVGFKATISGRYLFLTIGYSHDICFVLPNEVIGTVEKSTTILLASKNKFLNGHVASEILDLRSYEPYKGKGIKIKGEYIVRKEGKKK